MHADVQLLKKFLKKSFFFDDSFLWGAAPPQPPRCRRSALHPGDFPVAGKVTKGAPRAAPFGIPRCVVAALFALAAHRAGLPSATKIDRFATLSLWANRSYFFLWFHRGNTLCFQSVARQDCPRGCRRFYTSATNTARAQGRGIKGGEAPFAGGPGTRRFLAYLCLLSLREKVGRGAGRSARSRGLWGLRPHFGECRGATPLASSSRDPPTRSTPQKYPKSPRGSAGGSCRPGLDFFHRIGYNILDQQSLKGRCGQ